MSTVKKCNDCGAEKPGSAFYSIKPRTSGALTTRTIYLSGKCRECVSKYGRARRLKKNPDAGTPDSRYRRPYPRACTKCKIEKGEESFYLVKSKKAKGKNWRHSTCIPCAKATWAVSTKSWVERYPEKARKRAFIASLRKNYGLSVQQYESLADMQGGVCAICGSPPGVSGKYGVLVVDHNHETDRVRGLLCSKCNVGLGSFRDSSDFLEKASAYLKAWKWRTKLA